MMDSFIMIFVASDMLLGIVGLLAASFVVVFHSQGPVRQWLGPYLWYCWNRKRLNIGRWKIGDKVRLVRCSHDGNNYGLFDLISKGGYYCTVDYVSENNRRGVTSIEGIFRDANHHVYAHLHCRCDMVETYYDIKPGDMVLRVIDKRECYDIGMPLKKWEKASVSKIAEHATGAPQPLATGTRTKIDGPGFCVLATTLAKSA